jgi:hypothetical protein
VRGPRLCQTALFLVTAASFTAAGAFSQVTVQNNCPLDSGEVGWPYSVQLLAGGGRAPYTWNIDTALPKGLILHNGGDGTPPRIDGTPQAAIDNFNFTLTAIDNVGSPGRKVCSLSIKPVLAISPPAFGSLPIDTPYSFQLLATGGIPPYTFNWSGSTPPGLTLSSSGLIAGAPTQGSSVPYAFSVALQDGIKALVQQTFQITVRNTLTITGPSALPAGVVGKPYSTQLTAQLGTPPYSWVALQGSPPDGLRLDATGLISGTPSTPTSNNAFSVRVADTKNAVDLRTFSIQINKTALTVNPVTLPQGFVGAAYSGAALSATGGIGPYTWSISAGALPPGLTLSSTTGAIAGIPQQPATFDGVTKAATYNFSTQVQDAQGTAATLDLSIVINLGPLITTPALNLASIGKPYNQTLTASGGVTPYQWSLAANSDPLRNAGLDLNPTTGQITGTPAGPPKALSIQLEVRDKFGALGTAAFPLVLTDLAVTTNPSLPDGFPGELYPPLKLAAIGGSGKYLWTASGSLPPGLSLAADGTLSGTPTAVNLYTFTATLGDGLLSVGVDFTLSIKLRPIVPAITGVSSSVAPRLQPQIKVGIPQAYAVDIAGTLTLAFQAATQTATDDPMIDFSGGGRSVNFTIPAGNTDAVFGNTAFIGLQTGTTAGNLTLSAVFTAAGAPLVPNSTVAVTTAILAQKPAVTSPLTVNLSPTTAGVDFEVTVTGYSTTREMTDASFDFTSKNNFNLTTGTVTAANFGAAATSWYASAASLASGGTFVFTQPFKVTGDKTGIGSVTVTLKNTAGTSATATANFP